MMVQTKLPDPHTVTRSGAPAIGAPPTRGRVGAFIRRSAEPLGLLAALIVLCIVFSIINPARFPTVVNVQNILDQASVPLIVGVGATLVILMGSIDLSVEGLMGAAGMAFVVLSANSRGGSDLGFLAFVVAVGVGLAMGAVTGVIHTRLQVPSFIVTLGMWFVGLGIATLIFGNTSIPFLTDPVLDAWSSGVTAGLPNVFLLAAAVVLVGVGITRFTRLGRSAYAIGDNEAIARSNGIRVSRFKVYIFAIAGACSALAGVIASIQLGAGSATVGIGNLFLAIPAVVIGGTSLSGGQGGVLRTTLGVLLLITLNNGLILSGVSPSVESGVSGVVLIAAIVIAAWSQRGRLRVAK